MKGKRIILNPDRFDLTLDRLTHQLIEKYQDFEGACIIGIQPRGVILADQIYRRLKKFLKIDTILYGQMDITFYRDDFRIRETPIAANENNIDFIVEGKKVLLVDDVLYTGRTIQAALTALQHYGRPESVELLSLVDRQFNRHLPIQADYVGLQVDALDEAYVKVDWDLENEKHKIVLFKEKED